MYALQEKNGWHFVKALNPLVTTPYPSEAMEINTREAADRTLYLYGLEVDYDIVEIVQAKKRF